jgi:hypothetical protein
MPILQKTTHLVSLHERPAKHTGSASPSRIGLEILFYLRVTALFLLVFFSPRELAAQSLTPQDLQNQLRFMQLHGLSGSYELKTPAGTAFSAPLALNHTFEAASEGLSIVHGSFRSIPGQGTRVILKTLPFHGDGVNSLYSAQYFSGWRWFWLEVDGLLSSKLQGGFYDLTAKTLPSNESYTFDNNVLTVNWIKPPTTGYSTRVVVIQENKKLLVENSEMGNVIFTGDGQSATWVLRPVPGHWIHIGLFGVYNLEGIQIDSGSGTQFWPNDAGGVEPIGGVHSSSDLDHIRRLITIPVPRIDVLNKRIYKIIPPNAPQIISETCSELTTPTADCFLPWPQDDDFLTIHGFNWDSGSQQVLENGVALGSDRILDWRDDRIHVSLPSTMLTTTQPCLNLEYHISSTRDQGLESNFKKARVVNANFNYAELCEK